MEDSPDDIVFSGMAGRFPNCDSTDELWGNLVNGVDMVTENDARWPLEHYGLPRRSGVLKDLTKFDASFFGLNEHEANASMPYTRLLTEVAYESICDAGHLPETLRGSLTGVYVAKYNSDFDSGFVLDVALNLKCLWLDVGGMASNKLSFLLDLIGPSVDMDSACASSFSALTAAVSAIRSGECERAIVAGASVILSGAMSKYFMALGNLSPTGICSHLDDAANGLVKSEAVVSILVERRSVAKRVYGTLVHARSGHDGFKTDGIVHPSLNGQARLMRDTYRVAGVDPLDIVYVEAHGTATAVGDVVETTAIGEVFTRGRKTPLPVGSIKSNMGHSESAAGFCSLVKVLLTGEKGIIPRNLHFTKPNSKIECLLDGRIKAIDSNMDFPGGLSALTSWGMGGSGAHVIVRSNTSRGPVQLGLDFPRIVALCGRSAEAVDEIRRCLTEGGDQYLTEDFLALLDVYSKHAWEKMPFRGSLVLDATKEPAFATSSDGKARPLWFVMSGMGGQWTGMARGLKNIPWFKSSIDECAEVLKDFDIDLWDILLTEDESVLRQIVPPFVAITSMQVALVDLMRLLDVSPDGIIGFSLGEIASAYADGCLSLKQTVLGSYWRARCVELHRPPPGLMAVVGLSWEEASRRCPKGVLPACNSAETSVTISGPRDSVLQFVADLSAQKVFARVVDTNEVAYHHPHLEPIASHMLAKLETIIINPKERSQKWISTSTKDGQIGKFAAPQYFVNNLVSPVKFFDALESVPKNAIVVEIGPSALHKSAITKTLGSGVTYVNLMKRDSLDTENAYSLMRNVSTLYIHGLNPEFKNLYPQTQFPVGRGTPSLASLIRWRHDRSWPLQSFPTAYNKATASDNVFNIDLNDSEWSYLEGHNIDGRILFPASGYLRLVWETLARNLGKDADLIAVTFENLVFKRATILSHSAVTTLVVRMLSDGSFLVVNDNNVQVTGRVREINEMEREEASHSQPMDVISDLNLNSIDVYKELRIRGYDYSGDFEGLIESSAGGMSGRVKWTPHWAAFIDSCFHLMIIATPGRNLIVPTAIRKVIINTATVLDTAQSEEGFHLEVRQAEEILRANGLVVAGLDFTSLSTKCFPPTLQKYSFMEFNHTGQLAFRPVDGLGLFDGGFQSEELIRPLVALIVENGGKDLQVCDLSGIAAAGSTITKFAGRHSSSTEVMYDSDERRIPEADLVVLGPSKTDKSLEGITAKMKQGSWLLTASLSDAKKMKDDTVVEVASRVDGSSCRVQLFRKKTLNENNNPPNVVYMNKGSTQWIGDLQQELKVEGSEPVWLVSLDEPSSGILGFVNCVRLEPNGHRIRCLLAPELSSKYVDLNNIHFKHVFERNLVMSVIKNGKHGFYCHEDITEEEWTASCVRSTRLSDTPSTLVMNRIRDLSSLHWREPVRRVDIDCEDVVDVKYMSLDSHDMQVMGKNRGTGCGTDYSGIDKKGNRVMGFVYNLSSITSSRDSFIHLKVPKKWSLEEAATVPVSYMTVLYGLVTRANIQRGESVLIHCGAGAVGQAALHVAKHFDCNIFTTCGSDEKREFLKKCFKLTDDVIFNSRSASFEGNLLRATNGRGVDIVLNSLLGDLLQASVRCLAPDGRFVELGKNDVNENSSLGMKSLKKNCSFVKVDIDDISTRLTPKSKAMFHELVQKFVNNGAVKPIVSTLFKSGQEEDAFRFMTTRKHIGKVLIQLDDGFVDVERTLSFPSDKSYIIIGGLGGFGMELVHWMIERGVKKFLILSRNGIQSSYQRYSLERYQSMGAEVVISQNDVSNRNQAQQAVDQAIRMGPLGGIFNLAVVLRDGLFESQTVQNFLEISKSKVDATENFDAITRKMRLELDHFVCFSSVVSGRGRAGQTTYGYANSVMERICEKRFDDGLAGKAIQYGAIGDVGLVAERVAKMDLRRFLGYYAEQGISSCLDALEKLLKVDAPVVASYLLARDIDSKQRASKKSPLTLSHAVAQSLGILDNMTADRDLPLERFGLDSLLALDVKTILKVQTGREFTIKALKKLTLNEIASWESVAN